MKFTSIIIFVGLWQLVIGASNNGRSGNKSPLSPNKPSNLHEITEKLAIVSRITNGIALQKEISAKTINLNALLAELLKMDPESAALQDLRQIELSDLKRQYEEVLKDASTLGEAKTNADKVQERLKVLGDMENELDELKYGEEMDVMSILEFTSNITLKERNEGKNTLLSSNLETNAKKFEESLEVLVVTKLEGRSKSINSFVESLKFIDTQWLDVQEKLIKLNNFNETLKVFRGYIGSSKPFKAIAKIKEVSKSYKENFNEVALLRTDMKDMAEAFSVISVLSGKASKVIRVAKTMTSLQIAFEKMLPKGEVNTVLTPGFTKGRSDIEKMFKDFNKDWVKAKVIKNNQTILSLLKSELKGLENLAIETKLLEKSWSELRKEIKLESVKGSVSSWNTISSTLPDKSALEQVKLATSKIGDCLKDLNQITVQTDSNAFEESYTLLKELDQAATKTWQVLGEFNNLTVLHNSDLPDLIGKQRKMLKDDPTIEELQQIEQVFKSDDTFKNLLEEMKKVNQVLRKLKEGSGVDILIQKLDNWNPLTNMQQALSNTNLINGLDCLKTSNFDDNIISGILTFGSSIRSMKQDSAVNKASLNFIQRMEELKSIYINFLNSTVRNRSKRSTSLFEKMQNGLVLSQDIAKGVNLLGKMAELHDNGAALQNVLKSGDEVFDAMKLITNSIDIPSFKTSLNKLTKDLNSLDGHAKMVANGTLREIGSIFDEASTIPGTSIDSKLLSEKVAVEFEKSSNLNIQKSAKSFKNLGDFELDYAKHQSIFKTSSLSIIKIHEFFEDLIPTRKDSSDERNGENLKFYGMLVIVVVLFLLVVIPSGLYFYRLWKRSNPNSYLHLLQSGDEGKLKQFQKGKHKYYLLPIHIAIDGDNYEKLVACVKAGANVNAFFDRRVFESPLHLAIDKNYKMVKYLVENGADVNLPNSEYVTPLMKAEQRMMEGDEEILKIQKILMKYAKKPSRRRLPQTFPLKKYTIYLDVGLTNDKFERKYNGQIVTSIEQASHIIVKVNKQGSLVLDDESTLQKYLQFLFSGSMIMHPSWMKMASLPMFNLWCDHKYRVKSVLYKGETYSTLPKIYRHLQERRIPFLLGVKVFFFGYTTTRDQFLPLAKSMTNLGAKVMRIPLQPPEEDPRLKQDRYKCPYHFDNKGCIFFICDDHKKMRIERPDLDNKKVTKMSFEEALSFILTFEIHHHKLSGRKDETTIDWGESTAGNGEKVTNESEE